MPLLWLVLASLPIGICLTVGRIASFDWATYVAQLHAKEDSENRPRLSDGFPALRPDRLLVRPRRRRCTLPSQA